MKIAIRIGAGAAALLVLGWFAYVHSDQAVTLRLGVATLEAVPLPFVIYGSIIVGMLIVLGVGLRSDLRTRELIRQNRPPPGAADAQPDATADEVLEKADRQG